MRPLGNVGCDQLTQMVGRDWMHRYRTTGGVMAIPYPLTDWLR